MSSSKPAEKKYNYESPTTSIFFQLYFKPAYNWLCPRLFPKFLHPNVVTLLGCLFAYLSFLLIGLNSSWFSQRDQLPPFVLAAGGLLFLAYAVCDNCDGIQARRLGLSSPIGELFDHGADSLINSTTAQVIGFLYIGQTAEEKVLYGALLVLLFQFAFFLTHVVSVVSGKLLLGFRYMSIDEAFFIYSTFLVLEDFFPGLATSVKLTIPVPMFVAQFLQLSSAAAASFTLSVAEIAILSTIVIPALLLAVHVLALLSLPQLVSLVSRIFIYLGFAYFFAPYDFWWFFTWCPMFSLVVFSMVLKHMKESSLPWHVCLFTVAAVRAFFPAHIMAPYKAAFGASIVIYLFVMGSRIKHIQAEYKVPTLFTVPAEAQKKAQ